MGGRGLAVGKVATTTMLCTGGPCPPRRQCFAGYERPPSKQVPSTRSGLAARRSNSQTLLQKVVHGSHGSESWWHVASACQSCCSTLISGNELEVSRMPDAAVHVLACRIGIGMALNAKGKGACKGLKGIARG